MLVLSFTTIPPRFRFLPRFLAALEAQSLRPDRVELNLPETYRRFPGERPALPPLPDWVSVVEAGPDLGPSTKVIPALRRWRGQDVRIFYCDDDRAPDPGWIARIVAAGALRPHMAICERGRQITHVGPFERAPGFGPQPRAELSLAQAETMMRMWREPDFRPASPTARYFEREGHVDIMMGVGGVLVRPGFFHDDVFEDPGPLWPVDDIWLSGMAAAKGTPAWAIAETVPAQIVSEVDRTAPLLFSQDGDASRRELDWLGVAWFRETYGVWP